MIIWSPIEQFPNINFTCPKCSMNCTILSSIAWTNGCSSKYQPRLIHDVNSNVLLLSRIYLCSNGHEVYGHHAGLLNQLKSVNTPFLLWHSTGFTTSFMDHINQLMSYGISMQQCEQILKDNRVRLFYEILESYSATYNEEQLPDINDFYIWRDAPSRHAIAGCFLHNFWKYSSIYTSQMIVGTVQPDNLWLSCDHTFHSAANIGLFREVDGKWVEQYSGLLGVCNRWTGLDWTGLYETAPF